MSTLTLATVTEPARETPVVGEYDVAVLGGGPAGICAALAAARVGARVILVERYGFLGGMATAALVGPILGVYHWGSGRRIVGGGPWELLQTMERRGGALLHEASLGVPFDPEVMKRAADGLLVDAGVTLRFHSQVTATITEQGRATAVILESKSGRQAIRAGVFVDATGDGDVAAGCGAPFEIGRPSDGAMQPLTMVFRLGNVDVSKLEGAYDTENGYVVTNVREQLLRAVEEGTLPRFGGPWIMKGSTVRDGEAFVNIVRLWGSPVDVESISANEVIGREHVAAFVDFFRANVDGLHNCHLIDSGTQIGVRETRRFAGDYTLTQEDILEQRPVEDSVAVGGHIIDIHSPDRSSDQLRMPVPPYQIPFRCLIPRSLKNVLLAGRMISTTHEAHASTRVMATCMAIGQGAGVGAALAARAGGETRHVETSELVNTLVGSGAVLE